MLPDTRRMRETEEWREGERETGCDRYNTSTVIQDNGLKTLKMVVMRSSNTLNLKISVF